MFSICAASLILALKYNEDVNYSDIDYANVLEITIDELRKIEHDFAQTLDYKFYIDEDLYNHEVNNLRIVSQSNEE